MVVGWGKGYFINTVGQHGNEKTIVNYVKRQRVQGATFTKTVNARIFVSLQCPEALLRGCLLACGSPTRASITSKLDIIYLVRKNTVNVKLK